MFFRVIPGAPDTLGAMLRLALPLLAALALAGCTPTLTVTVDGYADASAAGKPGTYRLASGSERVSERDLQYQSHAETLAKALAEAGWTRVADAGPAATLIRFRWGVTDPLTEIREFDTPEFGITGYHLTQTRETDASGKTVTRAQMTPAYGRTGYTRHTDARVSYGTVLVLEAYDLTRPDEGGVPPQVWKTIVRTRDTRGDVRALLPGMLKAAAPHLARDTRGLVEIEIEAPPAR